MSNILWKDEIDAYAYNEWFDAVAQYARHLASEKSRKAAEHKAHKVKKVRKEPLPSYGEISAPGHLTALPSLDDYDEAPE